MVLYVDILYARLALGVFHKSNTSLVVSIQYTNLNGLYKLEFVDKSTNSHTFLYSIAESYVLCLNCRYWYGLLLFIITKDTCTIWIKAIPYYQLLIFGITSVIIVYISYKVIEISTSNHRCLCLFDRLQRGAISDSKIYYAFEVANHSLCHFEMADARIYILFTELANHKQNIGFSPIW